MTTTNTGARVQIELAAKVLAVHSGQTMNLLTDGKGFRTQPADVAIPEGWRLVETFSPDPPLTKGAEQWPDE